MPATDHARTVSTTVSGEPCRVTSPLLRQEEAPIIVAARDATLTAQAGGALRWFAVRCDNRLQAAHIAAHMATRDDLSRVIHLGEADILDDAGKVTPAVRLIPFRLLPRRWLLDWRETADRVEVREGASGSVYMTAVIDGAVVAEKRVPRSCACDAETDIARLRAQHPSLALFDFRPQRGEG